MANDKKKYKLSNLNLDEVSFVDSPACRLAKVVIFKRSDDTIEKVSGVQFNIGFRSEGGSEIQSVVFDSKQWDKDSAAKWLKDHNMSAGKVDETENTLRYRQKDPGEFTRFRMITPGAQMSKTISKPEDYLVVVAAVDKALRGKFEKSLTVRDMLGDSVYFESDGVCYRSDYVIEKRDAQLEVTVKDKVPVEIIYKEETTKQPAVSHVDPGLVFKLGQLKAKLAYLDRKTSRLLSQVTSKDFA